MKFTVYFLFLSLLFLQFSCKKEVKNPEKEVIVKDSIVSKSDKRTINNIGETLNSKSKKAISSWEEYQLIDELLSRYLVISNSEALNNAEELATLSAQLKDSVRVAKLKTPTVKVRLNVLNSECLRLKDMVEIPAIKQEEVTAKIKDILNAFSAVNAKINSIYSVEELESQLELDPDFKDILNQDISENKDDDIPFDKQISSNKSKHTHLNVKNIRTQRLKTKKRPKELRFTPKGKLKLQIDLKKGNLLKSQKSKTFPKLKK